MPGELCHRFGPGRLPFASRRDVGGGIAMAATGLLATLVWTGIVVGLGLAAGVERSLLFFLAGPALLVFAPVGVLIALVVGALVWRYLVPDEPSPAVGAVGGILTSVAALAVGSLVVGSVIAASNVPLALTAVPAFVVEAVVIATLAFVFATAFSIWLVAPLAMVGGWYHERARRDAAGAAA